jgi:hypothetical protein
MTLRARLRAAQCIGAGRCTRPVRGLCDAEATMAQAEEPGANPGLSRNCDRGATPAAMAVTGVSGDPGARNSGHRRPASGAEPGKGNG